MPWVLAGGAAPVLVASVAFVEEGAEGERPESSLEAREHDYVWVTTRLPHEGEGCGR
ncbi:unnamed protein product [Pararhodospirillum photometricum DSM 122]|uniref:Uncharacterized protein n=1 Tax=Pararhodospirillum photometricum DSM 122 TaxID=1150469 RepID=H6SJW4_PARPM|nr:unnamed protein product [Pararhodospirillum photometricum DSM 122]